jgi:hypothetical protein
VSLLQKVLTGSETHPACCSVGNEALSPALKRPWREINQSFPSSSEVKDVWT